MIMYGDLDWNGGIPVMP